MNTSRFETILKFLRPSYPVYDLCCDHGHLGLSALAISSQVHFVDQSEAALTAIRRAVLELPPEDRARVTITEAPAESLVLPDVPSDIVIAGVGIRTMIEILEGLLPKGIGSHRLILAPQKHSLPLRVYLQSKGYTQIDEQVVRENRRYREILVLQAGGQPIDLEASGYSRRTDSLSQEFAAYLKQYRMKLDAQRAGSLRGPG